MRTLRIVPIIHTPAETYILYDRRLSNRTIKAWQLIKPTVENCYEDWKGVQIYADGFAIPKKFKDLSMTPEKYKIFWFDRLIRMGSPMARLVKKLVGRGAILGSTEINEKSFWEERYIPTFRRAIQTGDVMDLDNLDRLREEYISKRINSTLRDRGMLLIGRKHVDKFEFDADINVVNV